MDELSWCLSVSPADVPGDAWEERIIRSCRNCAAVTEWELPPLFSCASCSSSRTRSEEEKTRSALAAEHDRAEELETGSKVH